MSNTEKFEIERMMNTCCSVSWSVVLYTSTRCGWVPEKITTIMCHCITK